MDTQTKTQPKITVTHIDFDTRIAITLAGMNVLLDRHDMSETRAAVEEAQLAPILPPERLGNAVLARAGDVIRQRGWCRDAFEDALGRVCAIGAIRVALGDPALGSASMDTFGMHDAAMVLMDRIAEDSGKSHNISSWNDAQPNVDAVLKLLY